MLASHIVSIETLSKEHVVILTKSNKDVEDSKKTCKDTTEKVEKLLSEVTTFMGTFQSSFESNTTNVNKLISSLVATLHTEKASLEKLDFPITPKAFLFWSFDKVEKAPESDHDANVLLISFYLKHGKPQYQTWSSKKIRDVKVYRPIETESFLNVRLKTARGVVISMFEFILEDLLFLNPFDWIYLFHLLLKDEHKYEPIEAHLKRMLISYIQEFGKMDVHILAVLRRKPIVNLKESSKDINKMKLRRIKKENRSVMLQQSARESSNLQKCLFTLYDKHIYSTSCLNYNLELIGRTKRMLLRATDAS
ncbi:unnamed protein product [Lactuca saligna]|uniref:Uncharacterized protein n=1 Tax=Lactuca saligna TaxID=75948 RepID=A0AA35ZK59_LACSI|nr:unnamed protein product [Lactuca saligna]